MLVFLLQSRASAQVLVLLAPKLGTLVLLAMTGVQACSLQLTALAGCAA